MVEEEQSDELAEQSDEKSGAVSRRSIGLISDTHGWLDPVFAEVFADVEMILHAGDVGKPEVLEQLEEIAPTFAVRGNIDGGELRFLPLERVISFGDKKIAMLHIAGSPNRPRKAARALIARTRPDVIVVGHSHIPVVGRVDETVWINPGAAGRQGFHQECFAARLHLQADGSLAMDRLELGPRARSLRAGMPEYATNYERPSADEGAPEVER